MLNFCTAKVVYFRTLMLYGRRLKMKLIVQLAKTKEFLIYQLIFECTHLMVCLV